MVTLTDEELMHRAQQNDIAAFGLLFDRYQARLVALLVRFCGDLAQAEDLAQEALWRAWENRHRYDTRRLFSTWLFVVARNVALNQRKRVASQRSVSLTTVAEVVVAQSDLDAFALRDEVRGALLKLPPEQRLCVIFHEYEGFSYREAAEILGCSEGAARVMAHRARLALRESLRPMLDSLDSEECYVR